MFHVPATRVVTILLGTTLAFDHAGGQTGSIVVQARTVACRATTDIAEMERVSATKDKTTWEKFIMPRLVDKRCVVIDRGAAVSIDNRLVRPNGSSIVCIRRAADAECWWVASDIR